VRKGKILSLVGFLGAVGTATALIGTAASGTGAYFSDNHPGSVTGTFGHVTVDVTGGGDSVAGQSPLAFDWKNMLPGDWKSATLTVKNTGTASEDVWLLFDDSNGEWSALNTLGTFGEFKVNGVDYNNLNNHYPQGTAANPGQTNSCGDSTGPIAYLPAKNALGTLAAGQTANFQVAFRSSACISNSAYEGQPAFAQPLNFSVMATQHGVDPTDPHNGAGKWSAPATAPGFYS